MSNLAEPVQQTNALCDQDFREKEVIQLHGAITTFRAGGKLYSALQPARLVYVVLTGQVGLFRLTCDGKRIVTEILEEGDTFGNLSFTGQTDENESAEALADSRLLSIDPSRVQQMLLTDSNLALHLLGGLTRRLRNAGSRLEEIAYRSVTSRVASSILLLSGSDGKTARVSHQFLADTVGTTRETVTRSLAELEGKELLSLGRCSIEIRNQDCLAEVASASSHERSTV